MKPLDLISAANLMLTEQGVGPPRQTYLKRAISNAYYAMFHCLCAMCADCLVGASLRNTRPWLQVYRSVDHGAVKRQCQNQSGMRQYQEGIRFFADRIVELQKARNRADYDPKSRFSLRAAKAYVNAANEAINSLNNASKQERTDFAIWNLFRHRL